MRQMDELRPPTVGLAHGEVLEIGLGTGLNLAHYGPGVKSLVGLDPNRPVGFEPFDQRVGASCFPVDLSWLRADRTLPFESRRFDCVVSTWTLCSVPQLEEALRELRRVLRPGGRLLFVEHGRAPGEATARWQDRLNPLWVHLADGCNMNRPIDRLVGEGGFRLLDLTRFRHKGPGLLAHMYRGIAEPR